MKKSNVVLGVLAGAAVGALIGILFAPDKGSKTRRKLYSKGEDMVDDLKDKVNGLNEKAHDLSRKATKLMDKFNTTMEAARREATDVAENAKSKFADLKDRAS